MINARGNEKRIVKFLYLFYAVGIVGFLVLNVVLEYEHSARTQIYFYAIIFLLLLIPAFFVWLYVKERKYKYEQVFLFTAFTWGLVFCLAQPSAVQADGHAHLGENMEVSHMWLGYDMEEITRDSQDDANAYVRKEDLNEVELTVLNADTYFDAAEGNWFGAKDDGSLYQDERYMYYSLGRNKLWILRYFFSSIGFALGRVFKLGQIGLIYWGKFCNILAYTAIGYVCMRLLPYGKRQMIMITMIPMILETYSSLHYDAVMIDAILLFFSLCLYLTERKEALKWYHYLLIAALWTVMIPLKYVYALMGMFAVPLFLKNKGNRRNQILILLSLVLLGTIVFALFGRGIMGVLLKDGSATWSFSYQLQHPLKVLRIFINNLHPSMMLRQTELLMGIQIGHFALDLHAAPLLIMYLFIVAVLIFSKGERIPHRRRIWYVMVCFITLWGVYASNLTRVPITEEIERMGLFGRYLIPVFMLLPLIYGTREEENEQSLLLFFSQSLILSVVVCDLLYLAVRNG